MKTNKIILGVISFLSAMWVFGCPRAAEANIRTQPDYVLLAITCWHEAGLWDDATNVYLRTQDCAGIARVIQYIQAREGVSFRSAWSHASPRLSIGHVSRSWMIRLNEEATYPRGFDENLSWEDLWQGRWRELMGISRAILAGEIVSECVAEPHAWGTYTDIVRGRVRWGRRWCEIECGDTTNHFGEWVRPGVTRRYGRACR